MIKNRVKRIEKRKKKYRKYTYNTNDKCVRYLDFSPVLCSMFPFNSPIQCACFVVGTRFGVFY